jgi:hypothetical protein
MVYLPEHVLDACCRPRERKSLRLPRAAVKRGMTAARGTTGVVKRAWSCNDLGARDEPEHLSKNDGFVVNNRAEYQHTWSNRTYYRQLRIDAHDRGR